MKGETSLLQSRTNVMDNKRVIKNESTQSFSTQSYFPIFDEIVSKTRIPIWISVVFLLIFLGQSFTQTIFWANLNGIETIPVNPVGFWKVYHVFRFFDYTSLACLTTQVLVVFLIIVFFFILIFVAQMRQYDSTRKFSLWAMIVLRFFIEEVFLVCLVPLSNIVSNLLLRLLLEKIENIYWGSLVFYSIVLLLFATIHLTYMTISSHSPYISSSITATLDPEYMAYFVSVTCFTELFSSLSYIFPLWSCYMAIFIHFVFFALLTKHMFILPFISMKTNNMFATFGTLNCLSNILFVLHCMRIINYSFLYLVGYFILAIIFTQIFYKLLAKQQSIIVKKYDITKTGISDPSIDQQMAFLRETDILESTNTIMTATRLTLQLNCSCFLDGTIFRFIADYARATDVISYSCVILSLVPGHGRLLNSFLSKLYQKRDLSFKDRFFIFQVSKVKTKRQSAVCQDYNEKIIHLKQMSKKCYEMIRTFWLDTPKSVSSLYPLYQEISSVGAEWTQLVDDSPNAAKGYDERISYAIECKSDFTESVVLAKRMKIVEKGFCFSIDIALRSFIRQFPQYLKNNLIDHKGMFINSSKKTGSSSSNPNNYSDEDFFGEIRPEDEEVLAKELINQPKLRLAYQRSIVGKKSKWSDVSKSFSAFVMVALTMLSVFIYSFLSSFFSIRKHTIDTILLATESRTYLSNSRFISLMQLSKTIGSLQISSSLHSLLLEENQKTDYINFLGDFLFQIVDQSRISMNNFNSFLSHLVASAFSGLDIYHLGSVFLEPNTGFLSCSNKNVTKILSNTTMKSLFSYENYAMSRLVLEDPNKWINYSVFCEVLLNSHTITKGYDNYSTTQIDFESSLTVLNYQTLNFYSQNAPLLVFLVSFIPTVLFFRFHYSDLSEVLSLIRNLPQTIKFESISPIRKSQSNDDQSINGQFLESSKLTTMFLLTFISSIVMSFSFYLFFYVAIKGNKQFESMANWMVYGSPRVALMIECLEHLSFGVLIKNGYSFYERDYSQEFEIAHNLSNIVNKYNSLLLSGTDSVESVSKYDSLIDDLHFKELCTPNSSNTDPHETMRCASSSSGITMFRAMINEVLLRINDIQNISNPLVFDIIHLGYLHVFNRLSQVTQRLNQIINEYLILFNTNLAALLVGSIVLSLIQLFFVLGTTSILDDANCMCNILLMRIPPRSIVSEDILMDYVLNKKSQAKRQDMSFSQLVIHNSNDALLFLSKNGIVELINQSVTRLLGYAPEQLLGQSVLYVFSEQEKIKLQEQITLIKNGQSAEVYVGHTSCMTDSNYQIQCQITLLGVKSSSTNEISSFVIILKDESELTKQQREAETAKKNSEDLLFQILPRSIVLRLNEGEKNISFSVNSASIMFIDIVKFSDYAASLTPQEIMGNLSMIFDAFDNIIMKYPLVTKIKLIGDIYMCASGLFAPDASPQMHAEQIIKFGLDCISELEEINMKLNSSLSVRIGVNSGGPIICGVLGLDKPLFDIIGDPINVASRLESTCVPGKIQIPQTTYDLISNYDFCIEKRGEVFLKGKGNSMAYFVSHSLSSLSSMVIDSFHKKD